MWRDGGASILTDHNLAGVASENATLAVDACGSASLLVRTRTWDAIGGADPQFFPAYYVDADLCLGVWHRGEAVLNTPQSRVRHHRASSTDGRFRGFLLRRNQALFCAKWPEALLRYEPPDSGSAESLRRALALTAERWRQVRSRVAIPPADLRPSTPAQSFAPIAPERLLGVAHQLQRAWSEELLRELERAEGALATVNAELGTATATLARVGAESARLRDEAAERGRELADERARGAEERARAAEQLPQAVEERARAAEERRRHALEIAPLRERDRLLFTIESGRWWRLYARLLPVFRALRRLSRRGGASRTG
jgi:hypothetical protein